MSFIIGALILFLLAKIILPAILVYIGIGIGITIAVIYIIGVIIGRDTTSIMGILGAIIFILLLLEFWSWV